VPKTRAVKRFLFAHSFEIHTVALIRGAAERHKSITTCTGHRAIIAFCRFLGYKERQLIVGKRPEKDEPDPDKSKNVYQ
jgi:hypothetical protein